MKYKFGLVSRWHRGIEVWLITPCWPTGNTKPHLLLFFSLINLLICISTGIRDIVEDITAQLRQFFQAHNGKGAARRLNAADGKLLDDAREFLTDAFGNLRNFTQQRAEKLKYTYDEATKDRAIQDIVGDYFPMDLGKDLLDDTMTLIDQLQDAESFDQAYEIVEAASKDYCTGPDYTKSEKKPTECEGPKVKLEFKPKSCVIDSKTHTIDCTPAQLILAKNPGSCTFKHHTPYEWTGKECKIEKSFGKEDTVTKGGEPYTVGHISDGIHKEVKM